MADGREQEVWNHHATELVELDGFNEKSITDSIKFKIDSPNIDVLDYGCGAALYSPTFKDFNYYGYDQNLAMIEAAQVKLDEFGIKAKALYQYDWNNILIDKQFDVVFSRAVIQHNLHPQKDQIVETIYSLIKPGGFYVCVENTLEPEKNAFQFDDEYKFTDETSDGYSFTRVGWLKYFQKFNFTDETESCKFLWHPFKTNFYLLKKKHKELICKLFTV